MGAELQQWALCEPALQVLTVDRHPTYLFIPVGWFRCALRATRCIGFAAISSPDSRGRRTI
jgi:hypothetical protein